MPNGMDDIGLKEWQTLAQLNVWYWLSGITNAGPKESLESAEWDTKVDLGVSEVLLTFVVQHWSNRTCGIRPHVKANGVSLMLVQYCKVNLKVAKILLAPKSR